MIRIVQCLCPARHAILAVAYDPADIPEHFNGDPDGPRAGLKALVEEGITAEAINPWCGICGSREFNYEDAPTKFQTLEEARPALASLEALQKLARSIIGQPGRN
jgi:hypothetical protein